MKSRFIPHVPVELGVPLRSTNPRLELAGYAETLVKAMNEIKRALKKTMLII